jgi:hypothetical protein
MAINISDIVIKIGFEILLFFILTFILVRSVSLCTPDISKKSARMINFSFLCLLFGLMFLLLSFLEVKFNWKQTTFWETPLEQILALTAFIWSDSILLVRALQFTKNKTRIKVTFSALVTMKICVYMGMCFNYINRRIEEIDKKEAFDDYEYRSTEAILNLIYLFVMIAGTFTLTLSFVSYFMKKTKSNQGNNTTELAYR